MRAGVTSQAMMTGGTAVFAAITLALGYVRASALLPFCSS
jgi:hypothetical protein